MKKWQVIAVTVMALLLAALSPMTALAQSDEAVAESARPQMKGSLAIVAPRIAFVGQEISMTVFLRANQEPFPGAGIWALTQDEADALRAELEALREEGGLAPAETDYESLVSIHGILLGRTGGDGKLYHTFEESDGYLLVAVKKGYFPGFSRINVREIPQALGIEAPNRAVPGQEITIIAFQRVTHKPVEGAGIWAVSRDKAEALKEEMQALRADTSIAAEEKDYEAAVSIHGVFLGRTNGEGELNYAFEEAGGYILVAVKRGYHPGFTLIGVHNIPNALAIRVPWVVPEGREFTVTVFDRVNQDPVAGAGIWAVTRDEMEVLREEMQAFKEDTSISAEERDYESLVSTHGTFLGRTDEDGELSYTFDEAGAYLLVAVKKGYIPGFAPVFVRGMPEPPTQESGRGPEFSQAPEEETGTSKSEQS